MNFNIIILSTSLLILSAFISLPPNKHNEINESNDFFLLIIIPSIPNGAAERSSIRNGWLNFNKVLKHKSWQDVQHLKTKHLFVIGTQNLEIGLFNALQEEKSTNNDLLLIDIEDRYELLTKKLLRTFRELLPINFSYLLKTDMDAFVNVPRLLQRLRKEDATTSEYLYLGYFQGAQEGYRTGKWADVEWNDCDTYLPYAGGGGYVLSKRAATFIGNNSYSLRTFPNEDTSVGFWLSVIKTTRIHDVSFNTEFISRGCRSWFIVSHSHTIQELAQMNTQFQNNHGMTICEKETTHHPTYQYDWTKLPSRCCYAIDV